MPTQKRLLLVEDEAVIALAEANVLRNAGYEVDIVHTGEKSVEAVRADLSIDLVLMDIDLGPGLSGPEAASRILELRSLPIVFLTSHSEREMVEKVRAITRYGYVIKNSGAFVLLSSIEMAFELFDAHRETSRQTQRQAAILQAIPDLMFVLDLNGTILDYHAPRGIGLAVVGTNIRELFPPQEAERHLALYRTCNDTGEVQIDSYELLADGKRRVYELRVARQNENLVLTVIRDITERVEAESELRKITAHYEYLFDNAPVPIALLDKDDRVVRVNSSFIRTFGYTREEVAGRPINDLVVPPELLGEGLELTRRVAEGESIYQISLRCRKDGTPVRVAITAAPIELDGSFFIYAIYQPAGTMDVPGTSDSRN